MADIIEIRLHESLPTVAQNKLRYAIELGRWKERWRRAEETSNTAMKDHLLWERDLVGLP